MGDARTRRPRVLYVPDYHFAEREREAFLRIGPRHFFSAAVTFLASWGWDVDIFKLPEPRWAQRLPQLIVRAFAVALRSSRYDLAVCYHGSGLLAAIVRSLLGSRKRNLVLIMFRPPRQSGWRLTLVRRAMRLVHAVLIVAGEQTDEFARVLELPPSRIKTVRFGVDTSFFERQWTGRGDYVLVVGDADRDNHAVTAVAAAGHHVIKTSQEKEDVADLRSVPGNDRVTLRTYVPFTELRELYARAALVISPLRAAGHPNGLTALAESLAVGCPTLISDGPAARLLDVGNATVLPDEWVEKVTHLMASDETRRTLADEEYGYIAGGGHLAQAVALLTPLLDRIGRGTA